MAGWRRKSSKLTWKRLCRESNPKRELATDSSHSESAVTQRPLSSAPTAPNGLRTSYARSLFASASKKDNTQKPEGRQGNES
jgi:hypothetical protein